MDTLSKTERSERMALIKGKNTGPEVRVRSFLYKRGVRYRLHPNNVVGKPDIALLSRRIAIFVHGCFWHCHDDPNCRLARLPKSRLDFWAPKLERNKMRDRHVRQMLSNLGWTVLAVWECQTLRENDIAEALLAVVRR